MARTSERPKIELAEDQKQELEKISRSRTAPAREVKRAAIILRYSEGESIVSIQKSLGVSRPTIYKCIDKVIAAGPERGLKDMPHSPKEPVITEEAKAWVVSLACTKPKDLGYAAEVWSRSNWQSTQENMLLMRVMSVYAGHRRPPSIGY
jgi:hypothetical protein